MLDAMHTVCTQHKVTYIRTVYNAEVIRVSK